MDQAVFGLDQDVKTITNAKNVASVDTSREGVQNRRDKSAKPLRSSFQPSHTRTLRSGTALGLVVDPKRTRHVSQSRRHSMKVWKQEDGVTPLSEKSTDEEYQRVVDVSECRKIQASLCEKTDNLGRSGVKSSVIACSVGKEGSRRNVNHNQETCCKTSDTSRASNQEANVTEKTINHKVKADGNTISLLEQRACINCQPPVSQGKMDFTRAGGMSDEVFFVSLSKDIHKELSVLSTSNGTLQVGSGGIHRKQLTEFTSSNKIRENSIENLSADNKDLGKNSPNGEENYSWRKDKPKGSHDFHFSNAFIDVDKLSASQIESQSPTGSSLVKLTIPVTRKSKSLMISGETKKTHVSSLLDNTESSPDGISRLENGQAEAERIPPRSLNENGIWSSKIGSMCEKMDKVPKIKLKPLSQFPLMEEILTSDELPSPIDSGKPSLSKSPMDQTLIAKTSCEPEAQSSIHTPGKASGVSLIKGEKIRPLKEHVKRSERIRSKTISVGLNPPKTSSALNFKSSKTNNESDIGIMNPLSSLKITAPQKHRRNKSLSSLPPPLQAPSVSKDDVTKLKSDVSTPARGGLCMSKKTKKKRPLKGRGRVQKRAKDFSKGKACMSQEVMDAIVKSIEETVSRVRRENDEEEKGCLIFDQKPQAGNATLDQINVSGISIDNSSNLSQAESILTRINETARSHVTASTTMASNTTLKASQKHRSVCRHSKHTNVEGGVIGKSKAKHDASGPCGGTADDKGKRGKRFRKKTRKAEEALGSQDIFWDDDTPAKKAKTRKKHVASTQEPKDTSGHRRSRRGLDREEQMSDPVLEEHAFILWASEHRSEIEQKLPNVSEPEMDSLLSARWCDVAINVKAKFFARAREAFSDDDRQLIKAKHLGFKGLDSDTLCGFFMDRDPNFHDFVLLPINRQRDFLRKWLKFFQKILPRREYIDFIITFKRACGKEDNAAFLGKSKRMRMRCLDPVHYKTLFDLIRLSKPRVLEAYKERRGKERKMVSNTYSNMLKSLINGDPWPHMIRGCRSKLLTQLLNDLRQLHDGDSKYDMELCHDNVSAFEKAKKKPLVTLDDVVVNDTTSNGLGTLEVTVSLTEQDYCPLDTDYAIGLMSDISKLEELPVLDQSLLDDVLQPPSQPTSQPLLLPQGNDDVTCLYSHTNINNCKRNLDGAQCMVDPPFLLPASTSIVNASACHLPSYSGPSCSPNMAPSNSMGYPKINIHYRSALPSTHRILHRSSASHTTAVVSYRMCHADTNGGFNNSAISTSKLRSCAFSSNHSNSSITANEMREHLQQCQPEAFTGRCIKMHPRHNQSQVRMSTRPYQVPISSLGAQTKHHQKSFPLPFTSQQKLLSDMCRQGMVMMDSSSVSKGDPNHLHHTPSGCRINSPSPLITSLSPFRTIKSCAQRSKSQGQHCQIVPQKSKIPYSSGGYHADNQNFWKAATAHAIPISTTLRPCGAASSRPQGGLGQIKVCLPTQALKIPIAKLRGARKATFVKGRMKSIHLPSSSLNHRPDGSLGCQSPHGLTRQSGQSVLAKVLSFQSGPEGEISKSGIPMTTSTILPPVRSSLGPPLITASRQRTSALHETNANCDRPDSQAHHASVMNIQSSASSISKMSLSGQTAVIINPLHLQRRPLLPTFGFNSAIVKSPIEKSSAGHRPHPNGSDNAALRQVKDVRLINSHGFYDVNDYASFHASNKSQFEIRPRENNVAISEALAERSLESDNDNLAAMDIRRHSVGKLDIDTSQSQIQCRNGISKTNNNTEPRCFLYPTDVSENKSDGLDSNPLTKDMLLDSALTIQGVGKKTDTRTLSRRSQSKEPMEGIQADVDKDNVCDSVGSVKTLKGSDLEMSLGSQTGYKLRENSNSFLDNMNKDETLSQIAASDTEGADKTTCSKNVSDPNCADGQEGMKTVTYKSEERFFTSGSDALGVTSATVATEPHSETRVYTVSPSPEKRAISTQHAQVTPVCKSTFKVNSIVSTCQDNLSTTRYSETGDVTSSEIQTSCQSDNFQSLIINSMPVGKIDMTHNVSTELDEINSKDVHQNGEYPNIYQKRESPNMHLNRVSPNIHIQRESPNMHLNRESPNIPLLRESPNMHLEKESPDGVVSAVVSVESPVKRSGSVVHQLPVFSQVTEMSTPVTASGTCRVSTGIFHLDDSHDAKSQNQQCSSGHSPRSYSVCSKRSTAKNSPAEDMANQGLYLPNDVMEKLSTPPSDGRSGVGMEETNKAEDTKETSKGLVHFDTSYHDEALVQNRLCPDTLKATTDESTTPLSIPKLSITTASASAPTRADDHFHSAPVVETGFTMNMRTDPPTKPLTVKALGTKGHMTTVDETGASSLSQRGKKAQYIHEYLPT